MKDGLPSNDIRCLFQDSRGFLWIGTREGLCLYDGNAFTIYTTGDGLPSNFISALVEDRATPGEMWIGTFGGGLARLSHGTIKRVNFHGTEAKYVLALLADPRGVLWCATESGIFQIDEDSVHRFLPQSPILNVRSLALEGDSTIWICSDDRISRYSLATAELKNIRMVLDGHPAVTFERLCVDLAGIVWVAAIDGSIFEIRHSRFVTRHDTGIRGIEANGTFYFLVDDGEGNLWAGTQFGLVQIPKDHIIAPGPTKFTTKNGLADDFLRSFLIDHEHNLWIGYVSKGLSKLPSRNIVRFLIPGGSAGGPALSSCDTAGHIWVPGDDGLLEIWTDEQGRWQRYFHQIDLNRSAGHPSYASFDRQQQLCVGFGPRTLRWYQVRQRRNRHSIISMTQEHVLPQPSRKAGILCFMFDHNNILWCSIQGLGVYVADVSSGLRTIRIIGSKEGLHSTSCRTLYEDHDGTIWIGGFSEGVACLERDSLLNGRPRVFTETDGLPDGHISRFTEDADGKLLAGTILGGLSVFDQGRFHAITTQDGLMSAVIRSMAKTPSGDVMVGTQRGLQLYNPRHHPAFSVVNEIAGNTIWTCGAYRDRFIWVITTGELLLYEYQPRSVQLAPPPIYITRLSVNGKSRNVDQAIELTYDQNNVILDYVGISFKNEQLNRYRYRMLETDSDWRPPTKQTSVTYAALKPGTYTFEVKAINSDGVESTNSASMSFVILSPFWMRWWFILLANILVLTIIAIVYRYRLNQLLKIERMRTQIATDLHDDIGASLTRIALFSEVAKEEAANASPKLVEMAEKIGTNARELLDSVGTLVWSIDPRHDRFEDVITNLKNFAQEMFSMKGIDHRFTVQNQASQLNLPLDARKNILLVFKEAINNIVKHANCQTVVIDLALRDGQFEMQIADDGKGIASTIFRPGHGLMNMRMRARAIGGEFDIQTTKGAGTTIVLKLPVKT